MLLALALVNPPAPWQGEARDLIVLLDESASIDHQAADRAWRRVVEVAGQLPADSRLGLVRFGTQPVVETPLSRLDANITEAGAPPRKTQVDDTSTDIAAALESALRLVAVGRKASIVLISDGYETRGAASDRLRQARAAGIPVHFIAAPSLHPKTVYWIEALRLPNRVRSDQPIPISVAITGQPGVSGEVHLAIGDAIQHRQTFTIDTNGTAAVEFESAPQPPGPALVSASISAGDATIPPPAASSIVNVEGRASILHVTRTPAVTRLGEALRAGGWTVATSAPERFVQILEETPKPGLIVLEDIAATDLSEAAWSAVARSVRHNGSGLLVLGGPNSFGAGAYRHSTLESLLPVIAEGRELEKQAAILFAVDTSGSMAEGDQHGRRLALARHAVQETARTALPGDAVGLMAFDVEPKLLLPLEPHSDPLAAVTRAFRARAGGGTHLLPALREAVATLSGAKAQQRLLVLVTDGFVGDEDFSSIERSILDTGIDVIALAVGKDSDNRVIKHLAGLNHGRFLEIGDIANLPRLMRGEVERRRPWFQAGPIETLEVNPLPFSVGKGTAWPPLGGYMVTTARPVATVYLQSAQGDPLFATHLAGAGRVAALPGGLGPWAEEWLARPAFGVWLGSLAAWLAGDGDASFSLEIAAPPGAIRVTAEHASEEGRWFAASNEATMVVEDPVGRLREIPFEQVAPGRWQADAPVKQAGRYRASVHIGDRSVHHELLYSGTEELTPRRSSPPFVQWDADGLVQAWPPGAGVIENGVMESEGSGLRQGILTIFLILYVLILLAERRRDIPRQWLATLARLVSDLPRHKIRRNA